MVSTTDDAGFAPRSAARAEHAPAGPRLGPGLGLGLDDAPEPLPPLLPPIPLPTDGDGPLPRRGHPGDPGFTWDHRNGYQSHSVIPDSRIDYVLVGLPRHGRGRVRSAALAGAAPVDDVWPSDHFGLVTDLSVEPKSWE